MYLLPVHAEHTTYSYHCRNQEKKGANERRKDMRQTNGWTGKVTRRTDGRIDGTTRPGRRNDRPTDRWSHAGGRRQETEKNNKNVACHILLQNNKNEYACRLCMKLYVNLSVRPSVRPGRFYHVLVPCCEHRLEFSLGGWGH